MGKIIDCVVGYIFINVAIMFMCTIIGVPLMLLMGLSLPSAMNLLYDIVVAIIIIFSILFVVGVIADCGKKKENINKGKGYDFESEIVF